MSIIVGRILGHKWSHLKYTQRISRGIPFDKFKSIHSVLPATARIIANGNITSGDQQIINNYTASQEPKIKKQQFSTTGRTAHQHEEIEHHAKLAPNWWDEDGPMKALHALNQIRVPFIRDGLVTRGVVDPKLVNTPSVLKDQKILDIGCGGGILSEQLARLGAQVTGIDLGQDVIQMAQHHLDCESPELKDRVSYAVESAEEHARANNEKYDAVVCSELLEHVDDKCSLLSAAVQALKPGGSIFVTGPNKTMAMWLGGILIGEYVLNIAPKGTHHWDKLISPLELQRILDTLNCHTVLINGSTYDFWSNQWRWINSTSFCFALQAIKESEKEIM